MLYFTLRWVIDSQLFLKNRQHHLSLFSCHELCEETWLELHELCWILRFLLRRPLAADLCIAASS